MLLIMDILKAELISDVCVFCDCLTHSTIYSDLRQCLGRRDARILRQPRTQQLGWPRNRQTVVGVWPRSDWFCADIFSILSTYCRPRSRRADVL